MKELRVTDELPVLRVEDLHTSFFQTEGTTRAVEGASFDVYRGRTVGVVGESGCGKTVTAKSILRLVDPPGRTTSGKVLLRASDVRRNGHPDGEAIDLLDLKPDSKAMNEIRGEVISLIFQEPMASLSLVHTVGNQIIEAIRLHRRITPDQARSLAVETLEKVGMPDPQSIIDRYPFELSGGLRQRVMIAMALSCDPEILIADEPTTALDVTTQAQILRLLKELQQRLRMAVILITHDMGVIAEMADDVVVMYLGHVVERSPVKPLFAEPLHPYTTALLRSIPSVMAEPRTKMPTISGSIPHPFNKPRGCPFHPRCPRMIDGVCNVQMPHMVQIDDRSVACHLYTEDNQ
jgi:peptide/nickel transport system ATP-binding protein